MNSIIAAIFMLLISSPALSQLQLPDDINKPISPGGAPVLNTTDSEKQQAEQQPRQRRTVESARRELARQMVETDLLDNPEKLMRLANFAAANGVTDQLPPFAALAQKAKRRAEIKTFQSLMLGNVDGAIDAAKLSGNPFADRPVKVKPSDPDDFAWIIMKEGGVETAVNVKTMFELYTQIAQSEDTGFATESRATADRQSLERDRQERKDLMDEQRRTLRSQREVNEIQTMRLLGIGGIPPIAPIMPIGGYPGY